MQQRPSPLHRTLATEVCKQLCVCLDDRSESLASAAKRALLAGASIYRETLTKVSSTCPLAEWHIQTFSLRCHFVSRGGRKVTNCEAIEAWGSTTFYRRSFLGQNAGVFFPSDTRAYWIRCKNCSPPQTKMTWLVMRVETLVPIESASNLRNQNLPSYRHLLHQSRPGLRGSFPKSTKPSSPHSDIVCIFNMLFSCYRSLLVFLALEHCFGYL